MLPNIVAKNAIVRPHRLHAVHVACSVVGVYVCVSVCVSVFWAHG